MAMRLPEILGTEIMGGVAEVLCYGTAVIVERK